MFRFFSELPCTDIGVSSMTNKVDIVSEIPKAPAMIQKMFKDGTVTPYEGMTVIQGQGLIIDWVTNDIYYPIYEKEIGFTAKSEELKIWPGAKQARDLMKKIAKKSPQLALQLDGKLLQRFIYDNTKRRPKMKLTKDTNEGNKSFKV